VYRKPLPSNDKIHRQPHTLSYDRDSKKMKRVTILPLVRVFVAAGTCSSSRCLATIVGNTHAETQAGTRDEINSGATIYIPSFVKIG
jgi:hypothetical protein